MSAGMRLAFVMIGALGLAAACTSTSAPDPGRNSTVDDRFSAYVWPPPPDEAKIQLQTIVMGRADVESDSNLSRALIGMAPQGTFDRLIRPIGCAFDSKGRLYVTDGQLAALLRFDFEGRRLDVLGKKGSITLKTPLGVTIGPDGTAYVADASAKRVVGMDEEGKVIRIFGRAGELQNPTDVAITNDGRRALVTDSKAHQVVVFEVESGMRVDAFGKNGSGPGEFNFPTSVEVDREGYILVVDAINARVQILGSDGEFLEQLGQLGTSFGQFVRPKDVATDQQGRIYVTDGAFNNVQIFDSALTMLTFLGDQGSEPGQFQVPGGVAVHGDTFAVVDQLNRRVQLFRYIQKPGESR